MKISLILAISALMAMLVVPSITAEETNAQTMCPIMGHTIDKNFYEDYEGKRVYFCCESCVEEFRKNPEKHMKELEAEGVVLEDAPKGQITCPVMGGAINKDIYSDYEGKRVYFCCGGCKADFTEDPEKYIEKLEADGVVLERVSKTSNDKKNCGPCPMRKTCGSGSSA